MKSEDEVEPVEAVTDSYMVAYKVLISQEQMMSEDEVELVEPAAVVA